MPRFRLSRFRDRASYKSSEVIGLFIISLFAGAVFCGLCMVVDYLVKTFLNPTG
jgi:hypothetical protein